MCVCNLWCRVDCTRPCSVIFGPTVFVVWSVSSTTIRVLLCKLLLCYNENICTYVRTNRPEVLTIVSKRRSRFADTFLLSCPVAFGGSDDRDSSLLNFTRRMYPSDDEHVLLEISGNQWRQSLQHANSARIQSDCFFRTYVRRKIARRLRVWQAINYYKFRLFVARTMHEWYNNVTSLFGMSTVLSRILYLHWSEFKQSFDVLKFGIRLNQFPGYSERIDFGDRSICGVLERRNCIMYSGGLASPGNKGFFPKN